MRIFNHPVKYIDKTGNVRDITLNVQRDTEGNFITVDNNIITTFSKSLTDGVSVEYNDKEVTMLPIVAGKQIAPVSCENNKDVFYILDSKTSIRYSLTYTGVKEDIIVKEYTGQTEYVFLMRTNGLKLTKINENVFLADEKDNIWGSLGNVIILTADSKNDTVGTLTFDDIVPNEEYLVSVCVPETFLSDPLTKYPICIDPTLTVNSTSIISDARISIGGILGTPIQASSPWFSAEKFHVFWSERVNCEYYSYESLNEDLGVVFEDGFEVGDVIMLADNSDDVRHAMIIVGEDYVLEDFFMSGNSDSRYARSLKEIIQEKLTKQDFKNGGIYFYKMQKKEIKI